eukprot:2881439-Lingulodinium_polyedra.AAC.1
MRTMLAMGSMQKCPRRPRVSSGILQSSGAAEVGHNRPTDVLPTTKPGGPRWKDVVYRAVIDEETAETLVDMESVEGVPEEECQQDVDGRPRKLKTILHLQASRISKW